MSLNRHGNNNTDKVTSIAPSAETKLKKNKVLFIEYIVHGSKNGLL